MSTTVPDTDDLVIDSDLPLAQFTVDQYLHMIEAGAFDDVGRIELLEGYLVKKMTRNPPHNVALGLLDDYLSANIPASWHVGNQESIRLDNSMPEPDLMIIAGKRRDYIDRHPEPSDVALIVEVADTSLRKDRRKAISYARNRIPMYWIVNLNDERVDVFEEPEGSGQRAGYCKVQTYERGDPVPCVIGGEVCVAVPVNEILP